ncbi:beta-galactosidase [Streptomyces hirsutus]|uniref:beta-galactosidase n=1 Tax=Streptomyces hirsutus TaxID=35620 RepID=UPI00332CDA39
MSLNTVDTYVPWNFHEPHPGLFHFTAGHDVEPSSVPTARSASAWPTAARTSDGGPEPTTTATRSGRP